MVSILPDVRTYDTIYEHVCDLNLLTVNPGEELDAMARHSQGLCGIRFLKYLIVLLLLLIALVAIAR